MVSPLIMSRNVKMLYFCAYIPVELDGFGVSSAMTSIMHTHGISMKTKVSFATSC